MSPIFIVCFFRRLHQIHVIATILLNLIIKSNHHFSSILYTSHILLKCNKIHLKTFFSSVYLIGTHEWRKSSMQCNDSIWWEFDLMTKLLALMLGAFSLEFYFMHNTHFLFTSQFFCWFADDDEDEYTSFCLKLNSTKTMMYFLF